MDEQVTSGMSWIDYAILILMLAMSTTIGIYHGFKKNRSNTLDEYLFGERSISAIPICLSNVASKLSSIGLVSFPVEAYHYGLQMLALTLGDLFASSFLYFFYLPVFYNLKLNSTFEYLEMRFNRITRLLTSAMYILTEFLYAVIVMYSSCLTISLVIPIPIHCLILISCGVCTIYTVLGGLRGIVWADLVQAIFIYIGLFTLIIFTIHSVGGLQNAYEIADKGGRMQFINLDPSPYARASSWTLLLSGITFNMFYTCSVPSIMQRYVSVSEYSKLKFVVLSSCVGDMLMLSLTMVAGVVIYVYYSNCDPVMNNQLKHWDQLTPYHIMQVGRSMPGLTGIFLGAVLSASLSSLSTVMNTLSAIIFEDFLKPLLPTKWEADKYDICVKTLTFALGILITLGAFQLNPDSGIYQLHRTFLNLAGGFIIFIFAFGLFSRNSNPKAAIIGAVAGVILTLWLGLGNIQAIAAGKIKYTTKITSIADCPANITNIFDNATTLTIGSPYETPVIFDEDVPYPYRISFNILTAIGLLTSFLVGSIAILLTKKQSYVDDKLLIPQLRKQNKKNQPINYHTEYDLVKH